MRKLTLAMVSTVALSLPMTSMVRADDVVIKDRPNNDATVKERVVPPRDDNVVVKERTPPRDEGKVIIKEK